MCGLAGFVETKRPPDGRTERLRALTDCIAYRGPDDEGVWVDDAHGVGLGHRRLSILDLSAAGHQPMPSPSGRYVIVYNGEVYNFEAMRAELAPHGFAFNGHSDTEVLLAGFEAWGIEATVQRSIGMFAFAVWDRSEQVLTLARDRFGVKPLAYGLHNGTFLFGSEIGSLRRHPDFRPDLDPTALTQYVRFSYVPSPRSIYRDTFKLRPGHLLTVRRSGTSFDLDERPYWSLAETVETLTPLDPSTPDRVVADRVEAMLHDAVGLRMISDVPIGAFLSGGVDSSVVVAMMKAQGTGPVKTFTIGFTDPRYDEAPHARGVAEHLKTDHHEFYVSPDDVLAVIPRLGRMYDEPFADSSQIPTYLVSELARRHVTVSLSGDGGDELFGGYNRYTAAPRLWNLLRRLPQSGRQAMASCACRVAALRGGRVVERVNGWLPSSVQVRTPAEKLFKIAGLVGARDEQDLYERLVSTWPDPERAVLNHGNPAVRRHYPAGLLYAERMMFLDAVSYLPDDILVKVDRASMAVSLESREPLLDHRLAALAWSLPMNFKIRDGQTKWVLRQVLDRHVPCSLIERPKLGFGVPIGSMMRGPLRAWADDLLAEDRLRAEGVFDAALVRQRWHEHLAGTYNWEHALWNVLMFQQWHAAQRSL